MADVQHLIIRKKVRDDILACHNCELHTNHCHPIPFDGVSPNTIMVIGEAPGEQENIEGRPFVGPAGKLVRGFLRHNGVGATFANAVCCYPRRTPTGREVSACHNNLTAQVGVVDPKFVLLLGGVAISAVWTGVKVTEVRGHWWTFEGRYYMATWHPSAVLRNQDLEPEFRTDIENFAEVCVLGESIWRNQWCCKCGHEAKVWVGPESNEMYGVPYCQKCYSHKVGIDGLGKARKPTKKGKPVEQSLLD